MTLCESRTTPESLPDPAYLAGSRKPIILLGSEAPIDVSGGLGAILELYGTHKVSHLSVHFHHYAGPIKKKLSLYNIKCHQ